MSACLRDSEIARFVCGELPEIQRRRLLSHLENCSLCRNKVDEARQAYEGPESDSTASTTSRSDGLGAACDTGGLPAIEGYDVLSRIHGGSQGIVYKAVQKSTNRTVAVKVLLHEATGHVPTERQKQRFEREINLAAGLRHPNIVTVYDSGLISGRYFFAMEYVHGRSLDEYLKSTPLTIADKLHLFATICSAINYAHQKGVIHRDLKPGNILVDASGEPHIVDFGLAKPAGFIATPGETPFTLTSQFMGTIAYASPEQTKGDPALIDTRSDIYSLGVILFEMLTSPGVYPYPMSPVLVTMFQTICHTPPRVPSSINREIGGDLDTIVLRALAKEPERRYQTVADLQQDVERRLAGDPISARRDSLPYLIRLKSRRLLQRHRIATAAGIVLLSSSITWWGAEPLFRWWPQPVEYFEYAASRWLAPPTPTAEVFDSVRIISINDQTSAEVESMAQREEFTDVHPATWRSVRRLHGRLMEKLARSGVKAVAWDIAFPEHDPEFPEHAAFDEDFIKGINALQAARINPVFAVQTWDVEQQQREFAAEILEQKVMLGGATMIQSELAPWRADLVVERDGICLPSFGMAAYAATRHPMMPMAIYLDRTEHAVHLRFSPDRSASAPGAATIELSLVRPIGTPDQDDLKSGLRKGDVVGHYAFIVPENEVLDGATIAYHEVFAADESRLRQWFEGKLVLIGDMRSTAGDRYRSNDGRELAGPQLNATLIDSLLRDALSIRYPRGDAGFMSMLGAAVFGALVACGPWSHRSGRWLALAAALVLIVLFSALAFKFTGYLFAPIALGGATLLCMAVLLLLRPCFRVDVHATHVSYASH